MSEWDVPVSEGDVIEVTQRYKVIGVDGPDVLTLHIESGELRRPVTRWGNFDMDRSDMEIEKINE